MGHEVGVTSLQLALAGAVVANGGLQVKPRLVMARQKPGQPLQRIAPEKPVRILRPETAITMRQMMEGVVLRGTGSGLANLKGYTSGGKTGSAQIYDSKAHVYTHHYNASFLGFAPVANPQIVIAVTLNDTTAAPPVTADRWPRRCSAKWPWTRCGCWMCLKIFRKAISASQPSSRRRQQSFR